MGAKEGALEAERERLKHAQRKRRTNPDVKKRDRAGQRNRVSLRFALDVDATQELIKIAPVGDCIDEAYRLCIRSIVADLKTKLPKALVVCCE
jgi:hypothetical protein